jgi:hypothetical protein
MAAAATLPVTMFVRPAISLAVMGRKRALDIVKPLAERRLARALKTRLHVLVPPAGRMRGAKMAIE